MMVALLVMCGLSGSSVRTAELEIPPRPPAENFSIHKGPPACRQWTDGCVNCSRDADGEAPACTNIGVACQPKAIRCVTPEARKQ
ncbi:MAG: hypothetical protein GY844_34275 [Bradyrhizobium sp.]|nr:hypothetical protein [Bradyrhizobium sp.]